MILGNGAVESQELDDPMGLVQFQMFSASVNSHFSCVLVGTEDRSSSF